MGGPWLLPIAGAVIGGGVTAAKGGSFGDIAKGALLGGATGGLASGVGSALGIGAAATKAGGAAKAATTVLSPQERLLEAAVGGSTKATAGSTAQMLTPKFMVSDSGQIIQNFADKPSALETAMKNVGYANTATGLIDKLSGSGQPEEPTQFLQPPQPQAVAQIPPEDLYQQLLRMSQQG